MTLTENATFRKTLSRVEIFENSIFVFLCGRRKRNFSKRRRHSVRSSLPREKAARTDKPTNCVLILFFRAFDFELLKFRKNIPCKNTKRHAHCPAYSSSTVSLKTDDQSRHKMQNWKFAEIINHQILFFSFPSKIVYVMFFAIPANMAETAVKGILQFEFTFEHLISKTLKKYTCFSK